MLVVVWRISSKSPWPHAFPERMHALGFGLRTRCSSVCWDHSPQLPPFLHRVALPCPGHWWLPLRWSGHCGGPQPSLPPLMRSHYWDTPSLDSVASSSLFPIPHDSSQSMMILLSSFTLSVIFPQVTFAPGVGEKSRMLVTEPPSATISIMTCLSYTDPPLLTLSGLLIFGLCDLRPVSSLGSGLTAQSPVLARTMNFTCSSILNSRMGPTAVTKSRCLAQKGPTDVRISVVKGRGRLAAGSWELTLPGLTFSGPDQMLCMRSGHSYSMEVLRVACHGSTIDSSREER